MLANLGARCTKRSCGLKTKFSLSESNRTRTQTSHELSVLLRQTDNLLATSEIEHALLRLGRVLREKKPRIKFHRNDCTFIDVPISYCCRA